MTNVVDLLETTLSRNSPQQRKMIAASIALLLSHYYVPDVSPELQKAQAKDWLDDLSEFGAELVAEACREWRRERNRRPTIADMRNVCTAITIRRDAELRPPAERYVRPVRPFVQPVAFRPNPNHEQMRREGRAISDEFARRHGFADIVAYEAAGGSVADVVKGIPSVEAAPDFTSAAEAVAAVTMRTIEASIQSAAGTTTLPAAA